MVTIFKTYNTREENKKIYNLVELRGLSTDSKPKKLGDNIYVDNGSMFIEIDTQDIYMYDLTGSGSWETPE